MEIWKDIEGFEGLYQVSDRGRVKRVAGHRCRVERILKPGGNGRGYMEVHLSMHGRIKHMYVHRLVAEAHVEKPSPAHNQVNHKNGDRADNYGENLEWVTCSENHKHAYRALGRQPPRVKGEAHGRSILTERQVRRIRKFYATGRHTQRELGEMFGVHANNIGMIVRRETWQHVA